MAEVFMRAGSIIKPVNGNSVVGNLMGHREGSAKMEWFWRS